MNDDDDDEEDDAQRQEKLSAMLYATTRPTHSAHMEVFIFFSPHGTWLPDSVLPPLRERVPSPRVLILWAVCWSGTTTKKKNMHLLSERNPYLFFNLYLKNAVRTMLTFF